MADLKEYLRRREAARTQQVIYLSSTEEFEPLERHYLQVRDREGRLYSDTVLRHIPDVEKTHPLYHEWQIRKRSLRRFKDYVERRRPPHTILDLGCGNGWIAHQLAQLADGEVFAMDVNRVELEQGARVFAGERSLTFLYGNILKDVLPPESFDLIILASAIQYFPDLGALLPRLSALLRTGGEIHIWDSPFYDAHGAAQAAKRTEEYYRQAGAPEMAQYYHHHTYERLSEFRPVFLYNPHTPFRRAARRILSRADSPFPWIKIARSWGGG